MNVSLRWIIKLKTGLGQMHPHPTLKWETKGLVFFFSFYAKRQGMIVFILYSFATVKYPKSTISFVFAAAVSAAIKEPNDSDCTENLKPPIKRSKLSPVHNSVIMFMGLLNQSVSLAGKNLVITRWNKKSEDFNEHKLRRYKHTCTLSHTRFNIQRLAKVFLLSFKTIFHVTNTNFNVFYWDFYVTEQHKVVKRRTYFLRYLCLSHSQYKSIWWRPQRIFSC